jgi:V8-like Glu-specific endopeptidase
MVTAIPGDALLGDAAAVVPVGPVDLGLGSEEARRVNAQKVSNPKSKPYRAHGKVFFTDGGLDYVCSGTSVESKTKSLVVTAGHCTHSSNGYVSNFMFDPAFDHGPSKFGEWTAKSIKTTPGWENSEDIRYDVGMATMDKRNGKKLGNVVGSRGITFGKGRNLDYDVIGYPAEDPYDGKSMYKCDTKAEGTDHDQKDPEPTRVDCDQTGGSSGGGWVTNSGSVNSVVSYGYECTIPIPPLCDNPEEGKLFGPYFGNEIKKLYKSQK